MLKKTIAMAALIGLTGVAATPALAGDDTVLGALLGAGVGAVIGHGVGGDRGAVIGGAVGAVAGASIANADGRYQRTHYEMAPAYYPPPAPRYYEEVPVFERRGPVVVEQVAYPPRFEHRWHEEHRHHYERYERPDYRYGPDDRHGEHGRHHDWR